MLDFSTSCVHTRVLLGAVTRIASSAGGGTSNDIFERWPVLDNARRPRSHNRVAHYATHTKNKGVFFAYSIDRFWCAVISRPRLTRSASTRRRAMRATRTQLSCETCHWWCMHATAVSDWCAEAVPDGAAGNLAIHSPSEVRLMDSSGAPRRGGRRGRRPGTGVGRRIDGDGQYAHESRWRDARDVLPCMG